MFIISPDFLYRRCSIKNIHLQTASPANSIWTVMVKLFFFPSHFTSNKRFYKLNEAFSDTCVVLLASNYASSGTFAVQLTTVGLIRHNRVELSKEPY